MTCKYYDCNLTSIELPMATRIGWSAFEGCRHLTSVFLPKGSYIYGRAFFGCSSLRSVEINGELNDAEGEQFSGIETKAFAYCTNLEDFSIGSHVVFMEYDIEMHSYCATSKKGVLSVHGDAFEESYVEYASLHVPEEDISLYTASTTWGKFGTINTIGEVANWYKMYLSVNNKGKVAYGIDENESIITDASQTFDVKEQEDIVLTLTAYEGYKLGAVTVNGVDKTAAVTSEGVLTITDVNGNQTVSVEFVMDGNSVAVTIGELGAATFCCEEALDFSGTEEVKAYIVSAFHPATGKVTLTRITDVPAGTGIVLLGNAGTYDIPLGAGETYVLNMLVGVTADKVLNKTEGANSNFILANGENGVGFYAVKDGSTLAAGKAYLSLPTAVLPSSAQSIGFRFDEATNIASPQPSPEGKGDWYDLSGRRVNGAPTAPGLYIKDGRKVIVK